MKSHDEFNEILDQILDIPTLERALEKRKQRWEGMDKSIQAIRNAIYNIDNECQLIQRRIEKLTLQQRDVIE